MDDPSAIISKEQFDEIWEWLPSKYHNKVPKIVFCSDNHGFSLNYLYKMCESFKEDSMIFLVKTDNNTVNDFIIKYEIYFFFILGIWRFLP